MESQVFEGWAILELMGHRKLAGLVSQAEIACVCLRTASDGAD